MKLWLLNSAVIPAGSDGLWRYKTLSWEQVKKLLAQYPDPISRIGYPQTAEVFHQMTGYKPAVCRETSVLEPGDKAIVVRLKYRITNPADKGQEQPVEVPDWDLALLEYVCKE